MTTEAETAVMCLLGKERHGLPAATLRWDPGTERILPQGCSRPPEGTTLPTAGLGAPGLPICVFSLPVYGKLRSHRKSCGRVTFTGGQTLSSVPGGEVTATEPTVGWPPGSAETKRAQGLSSDASHLQRGRG